MYLIVVHIKKQQNHMHLKKVPRCANLRINIVCINKNTHFSDITMRSSMVSGNFLFKVSGNTSDHEPTNNARLPYTINGILIQISL